MSPAGSERTGRRPNLLVIGSDQHRWYDLGCYGNAVLQTPNIDRLAREGTRFGHSFVTCPLCVPSRASMWSARYPHSIGVTHNDDGREVELPDCCATIGDLLSRHGYRCGYIGKWHVGREETPQHGFKDRWFTFLRNSYEDWLEQTGQWTAPDGVRGFERRGKVPFDLAHDTVVTNQTMDFISAHRDDAWFAVCGMRAPHDPYIGPFDGLYDPADVPLPPNADDDLSNKPHCQRVSWGAGYRQQLGIQSADDLRAVIARYWGLVHLVDVNVGRLLNHLDELGLAQDTVVAFWVDHGDMMGAHSLLSKGPFMYEETNRVPFIIRAPGLVPAGQCVDALASVVDYAPTLLDLLGVRADWRVDGTSLLPAVLHHGPGREVVFAETFETYRQKQPVFMARTRRWKYSYYAGDTDELYDLDNDPHELMNLAGTAACRGVQRDLQTALVDWLRTTGDVSLSDVLAKH
jgi:arylsulfatase A-like enzyme